eukprot:SAG11_NODE_32899_length_280_cov_0.574586_1_plen_36_part_10
MLVTTRGKGPGTSVVLRVSYLKPSPLPLPATAASRA